MTFLIFRNVRGAAENRQEFKLGKTTITSGAKLLPAQRSILQNQDRGCGLTGLTPYGILVSL